MDDVDDLCLVCICCHCAHVWGKGGIDGDELLFLVGFLFQTLHCLAHIVALLLEMEEISMSGYGTVLCSMPSHAYGRRRRRRLASLGGKSKSQDGTWWGQKRV